MSAPPCQACGGNVPAHHRDWCSRACRAALRSYGSALAPTASRAEQMERALAQRKVMAAQGWPLAEVYRRKTPTS